jgi:hypothetical protein
MDKVLIVRLQTGEDVIAKYTELEGSGEVILTDPMTLIFKQVSSGKAFIMSPWLPVDLIEKNQAYIFMGDIITQVKPKRVVIEYYKKIVNETNIEVMQSAKDIEESLLNDCEESFNIDDELFEDDIESFNNQTTKKQLLH